MIRDNDIKESTIPHAERRFMSLNIEEITLLITLGLAIIGIGVSDFSPAKSYFYWGVMTLMLAIASSILSWYQANQQGQPIKSALTAQLLHWCATGVAVTGVFLLLKTGRLNYESTGLVLLLILGLSTFLDGTRVGWRFALIGLLMVITSMVAAFTEEYMWLMLMITIVLASAVFFWEKHRSVSTQEQK